MKAIEPDFYLKKVCDYIAENEDWYLTRFGYAACELWFCLESCNILNFDHNESFFNSKDKRYCFNEDEKRDLTIYDKDILSSHIEVKVLYSSYPPSKIKENLTELFEKFNPKEKTKGKYESAWVLLIWSSLKRRNYADPDCFFKESHTNIYEFIKNNNTDNGFIKSEFDLIDVLDGEFTWKGSTRRVVVKAISFSRKYNQ